MERKDYPCDFEEMSLSGQAVWGDQCLRLAPRYLGLVLAVLGTASCGGDQPSRRASSPGATSAALAQVPDGAFTAFESGQVRPLVLSGDGKFLYAANTPDNRVEIFRVDERKTRSVASVPVGLEPVALAERRPGELWVVNHLSDSVSIVDVSDPERAHVMRTLLVGDEPRDIVFAGSPRSRAFITTAHRGQNTGRDPEITRPGVGRADVWVFDADNLGSSLAGTPLTVVTLFADTPRALTVSSDGRTVYAAAFQSGNETTVLTEPVVSHHAAMPLPHTNAEGAPQPATSLIVKRRVDPKDGQRHWLDNIGRRWDDQVKLSLPDKDVFAIDATATPPVQRLDGVFTGVGTVLFNMATNPVNGKIYVSNLEARNDVRFEGHNVFGSTTGAPAGSVRGHMAENRVTTIDPANGSVAPRHLNKHLDFTRDGTPVEAESSLALPTDMLVSPDGKTLYLAAMGSSKVGVFSTRELENDSFTPSAASQIPVTGGGPTGLALDARAGLLYVLTRFDNSISVVDVAQGREVRHVAMFNPEPASITRGRRFLYDATLASSHGDSACASCHIFGDFDSLAWDLGDPDDIVTPIPGPFAIDPAIVQQIFPDAKTVFHPLKGPMTTQSLRGLANHGPMHWRGDRTGGTDASRLQILPSAQPDTGTFDEQAAFNKFNGAFEGLLGRSGPLTPDEMQAFTDFILQVTYPPNPIRRLDNSLTPDQQAGHDFYFAHHQDGTEIPSDLGFHNCNGCHTLDTRGNAEFAVSKPGFFGTDGRYTFETESQFMKVPHLRNMYQKVGMFGMAATLDPNDPTRLFAFLPPPYNDESFTGDQVRGFGFLHDGSCDTVFRFHSDLGFAKSAPEAGNGGGIPIITDPNDPVKAQQELLANITLRRQLEAFTMAFDSNVAPIVGQQATLTAAGGPDVDARIGLLEARAAAGECDLVVQGVVKNDRVAFLYQLPSQLFLPDRERGLPLADGDVRALARRGALTFTAVPVGSGRRIALDRDLDGTLNGDQD